MTVRVQTIVDTSNLKVKPDFYPHDFCKVADARLSKISENTDEHTPIFSLIRVNLSEQLKN